MTKVRNAANFKAGASSTGFWAGMTIGRVGLSFLTSRLGEFRSVIIYLGISIAFQLVFWLVPNFIVSAIAVAFLGMFIGPMFPTAMVLMNKTPAERFACREYWVCNGVWRIGRSIIPVHYWRYCAKYWCQEYTARYLGYVRWYCFVVALFA